MGQIGKSQFLALKFDRFDALASALEARAAEREHEADELARDVENPQGAGEWTGAAGQAAQVKCAVITGSMKKQSSTEQGAASAARACGSSLQSHKDVVVGMLDDIEQHRPFIISYKGVHKDFGHAKVGEDWKVIPPPVQIPDAPADVLQSLIDAQVKIDQDDLDARLKAFFDEDEAQAQKIAQAADFDQVASGDALAGETPEQAKKDAADVLNGTATEDEKKRVAAATNLDDGQMAALKNGDPVALGPEAWSVVYQMQRAMDGKSPEEIKAMLDRLPQDQKEAFQKSLQLASNPNVGSGTPPSRPDSGVKSEIPQQGGEKNLPNKIQAALDRQHVDQVVTNDRHANPVPALSINGLDEMNAIADIVKGTPAGFQQGSDIDRGLMNATAEYAHAYETARSSNPPLELVTRDDHAGFPKSIDPFDKWDPGKGEGQLQNILSVAAQDHIVDHDVMTDPARGQQFINDVLKHPWADHGAAASSLFNWEGDQSHVGPGVSDKQAALAGSTMGAVANYLDGHQRELLKLHYEGANGNTSLGQLNPELTKALAHSLSPYWVDMANGHDPGTREFHLDQGNDMLKSAHIASVIDSNAEASTIFNRAGMEAAVRLNQEVGQSLANGDPHAEDKMGVAGRISGIIDKGLMDEAHARGLNDYDASKAAYDAKTTAWKVAEDVMKTGEMVPVGGKIAKVGFDEAKDALKHWLVGDPPALPKDGDKSHYHYQHAEPTRYEQMYQIAAAMQAAYPDGAVPNPEILQDPRFTDGAGHLKPFDQIPQKDRDDLENRLMNWLDQQKIGVNGNAGLSIEHGFGSFNEKYKQVLPPSQQG